MPSATSQTASSPHQQAYAGWELNVPVPIVAAIITVLGAILVGYIVHLWNASRTKKDRLAAAARDFRASINEIIAGLDALSLRSGIDLVHGWAHENHAAVALAVDNFTPFLSGNKCIAFRNDWLRYQHGTDDRGNPYDPAKADMPEEMHRYLCYSEDANAFDQATAKAAARKRLTELLVHASDA